MANSVYAVNKGINKSIEFRGLKAQYIWYFAGGIIGLLILFAVLYISGVNALVCVGIILITGAALTIRIYALSSTYGEHGMMKKLAGRSMPKVVRSKTRAVFRAEEQVWPAIRYRS